MKVDYSENYEIDSRIECAVFAEELLMVEIVRGQVRSLSEKQI